METIRLSDKDVELFKSVTNEFLKVCNNAMGNEQKDKNGKIIPNFVEGAKTRKIKIRENPTIELGRKYAIGQNTLLQLPYINIGWINLMYDWKSNLFYGKRYLVLTSPNSMAKFKKKFDKPKEIFRTYGMQSTYDSYWELNDDFSALKNQEDYEKIIEKMVNLFLEMPELYDNLATKETDTENLILESEALDYIVDKSNLSKYAKALVDSKNIILRGAPGTGKTYLAHQIAAEFISNGKINDFEKLTNEQQKQMAFVQFHPSYDYTDFVEGLRPITIENGQMTFKLEDGIFKQFVKEALEETQNSTNPKPYIFIIDEINRGEISKIFGELFFSIDPGYRGKKGQVATQYANLHSTEEKFYIPDNVYILGTMNDVDRSVDTFDFAMRRRFRFIEIKASEREEILNGLDGIQVEKAKSCMNTINQVISSEIEDLNSNYHIGPAYFLKLKDLNYDYETLWTDYLEPLIYDYVRGLPNELDNLNKVKQAYNAVL